MSGIIGHTMYAILAAKVAREKKLPIAPAILRHWPSYLAASYLGSDIQTLAEAICVDTGEEVGYGTVTLKNSPITGGPVKPWTLEFAERQYTPRDIHRLFYGRAHVAFGWSRDEASYSVPWDRLPDYFAAAACDAIELFGPGERKLAYLFGWIAHVIGDSLIKSVRPGITLNLLDGKYTPANRPIQDLVTFHEIGCREFKLDWADLLADLADTPIEVLQPHYMRVARPRGALAKKFPDGWTPQNELLLLSVLAENRRYQRIRNMRLLKQYALTKTDSGWQCDQQLSQQAGGLGYPEMVELADKANFRHALWQMGEAIARMFEQVIQREPLLQEVTPTDHPAWSEITDRWKAK